MASASRPPPPSIRSIDFAAALGDVPVFPLPNAVLFPGALLPLHVFEPRYREMTRQALATTRVMAVALTLEGEADAHGNPPIAEIAGVGVIVDHTELPDGRYHILLRGEARARLVEHPFLPPYRRARAEVLVDEGEPASTAEVTALMAMATAFAGDVRQRNPAFEFDVPAGLSGDRAADYIAQFLVIDTDERQALLETRDPAERVHRTFELIATQREQMTRRHSGPPS